MNTTIHNPVLPGFHPDPAICRRGDDYYIATSTFEWYPGVLVYHSRDLAHWRLVSRPLDRLSLLDLTGVDDARGIWAPCLTWADDLFWLVYTDMKDPDMPNYLTTAPEVTGPWSERVTLPGYGFDPSLFHDAAGRKWLLMMDSDRRPGPTMFAGILAQEFDVIRKRVTGPVSRIFSGTLLGRTEGPHLYARNGWYYLVVAEGGTGYDHAVTVARSRQVLGPYEVHPENPILTSAHDATLELQKAGHASWVELSNGRWFMAYLCARPLTPRGRCTLGRETALGELVWGDDNWPRLKGCGRAPQAEVEVPIQTVPDHPGVSARAWFRDGIPVEFQSLRKPVEPSWAETTTRRGWLRLKGRHTLGSRFEQSLLARRVQHFKCRAQTCVDIMAADRWHSAGLTAYYKTSAWFYLHVTADEEGKRVLGLSWSDPDRTKVGGMPAQELMLTGPLHLRLVWDWAALRFYWSADEQEWMPVGSVLDGSVLSDEYCNGFTGAMVGITCVDRAMMGRVADFSYFDYEGHE